MVKQVTQTAVNDQNSERGNDTASFDPFSGEVNRYQGGNDWVATVTGDGGGSSEISSGAAATVAPSPVAATSNPRSDVNANRIGSQSQTMKAEGLNTKQQQSTQQQSPKSDIAAAVVSDKPKSGSSEAANVANQVAQDLSTNTLKGGTYDIKTTKAPKLLNYGIKATKTKEKPKPKLKPSTTKPKPEAKKAEEPKTEETVKPKVKPKKAPSKNKFDIYNERESSRKENKSFARAPEQKKKYSLNDAIQRAKKNIKDRQAKKNIKDRQAKKKAAEQNARAQKMRIDRSPIDPYAKIIGSPAQAQHMRENLLGVGEVNNDGIPLISTTYRPGDPNADDFLLNTAVLRQPGETDDQLMSRLMEADYSLSELLANQDEHYKPGTYKKKREEKSSYDPKNPKAEDRRDVAKRRYEEAQTSTADMLLNPFRYVMPKGAHFEKVLDPDTGEPTGYEKLVLSEAETNAINLVRSLYDCPSSTAFTLIMYAGSIGVDNEQQIYHRDIDKVSVDERTFTLLANQIYQSQQILGHPMGVVDGQYVMSHGTKCYPCPYLDDYTLNAITRMRGKTGHPNPLYKKSKTEVRKMMKESWLERGGTLETMARDTRYEHRNQREAVFNFVRAAMSIDEKERQSEDYGVPTEIVFSNYFEIFQDKIAEAYANSGDKDMATATAMAQKNAAEAWYWMDKNKYKTEEDKETKNLRVGRGNVSQAFGGAVGIQKSVGVLNPPLIFSAMGEAALGQGKTKVGLLIERSVIKACDMAGMSVEQKNQILARHQNSIFVKNSFTSVEAEQTLDVLSMVAVVGGMDALNAFSYDMAQGKIDEHVTQKDAAVWLQRYVIGERSKAEIEGDKDKIHALDNMNMVISTLVDKLMTGGGLLKKVNLSVFLDAYNNNMLISDVAGEVNMTTADLEESIRSVGVQKTLFAMLTDERGLDALKTIHNLDTTRRSPATAVTEQFLRNHGVLNFFLSLLTTAYQKYGVGIIELFLPMSNSISYAITKNIVQKDVNGVYKRVAVTNQLGLNTLHGLRKCIILDCLQLGSTLLIACFIATLHAIFAGDDDDEPDPVQDAVWTEYAFGGTKVVPAWWSYDLTGWGLPLGTAMYVGTKYNDPKKAWNIFVNASADALSGSAVLDNIQTLRDCYENAQVLKRLAEDENYTPSEEWKDRTFSSYADQFLATLIRKYTPGFANSFTRDTFFAGKDAYDRTAYKYYTGETWDDTGEMKTATIESYDEILRRTWAKNNIGYAALLNLLGGASPNQYNEHTGYFFWDMPVATKADQRSLEFYDRFEISDEILHSEDSSIRDAAAEDLIRYIEETYSSAEDAIGSGFILPHNARSNLKEYCTAQKMKLELEYLDACEQGMSFTDSREAYYDMKEAQLRYDHILDYYVYNSSISSSVNRYTKLLSDTETVYQWKDSGESANALEYFVFGNDKIQKKYLPTGNNPTSYALWTTVNDTGAYNQETPVGWYNPNATDKAKILSDIGDYTLNIGQEAGQKVGPLISGSKDPLNQDLNAETGVDLNNPDDPFTINRRSYVYTGNKLSDDFTKEDYEAAAARAGIDYAELQEKRDAIYSGSSNSKSSSSGGSGGGGRSYGYGSKSYTYYGGSSSGGSGSYNPKIYSTDQRVYNTKAQGMDVRSPYKASTTYLRPGFATKGSREAYKRQDM